MKIDNDTAYGIGIALNEATLLGVEYDPIENRIGITFFVLTLPNDHSPEPSDCRRQVILTNVGRVAAALRNSRWNDLDAKTIPFEVSELLAVVQSFKGLRIYGWEFINTNDKAFLNWETRLSLDHKSPSGLYENQLSLFQEGITRHLDLWIWFEDMLIYDPERNKIELSDFITDGKRWWDALYKQDPRTQDHGIFPLGKDS
jgi:hypothetical protein